MVAHLWAFVTHLWAFFRNMIKCMSEQGKGPKYVSPLRKMVGQNVDGLMARKYRGEATVTARQKRLAKDSEVAYSTVQRVINGDVGASVDVLDQLSTALDVSVYHLFLPNLDVENPQIIQGATEAEKSWYTKLRKAQQLAKNRR